jgi:hypothetical protein
MESEHFANVFLLLIATATLFCTVGTIWMLEGYARYPEDNL